jgi:MFS transporter, ACS family, tartrate transporter
MREGRALEEARRDRAWLQEVHGEQSLLEPAHPSARGFRTAQPGLGPATVAKLTWRLLPFLFLLYIVAYLDRINVGFAALQMQRQLGFNDAVYGLGAGMFFAGYFFFQIPSNLILQRVGAKLWISVLLIAWGLISCSGALVTTPRGFYAQRLLLGLAEAGFFPGVILYLKSWFPANAQARTVAWFMTAGPLSGVVGGPISGALLSLHQRGGLAGWQWLFLLEGLPAVALGAVVLFYLHDHPQEAHWLSVEQRAWLIDTLSHERQPAGGAPRANAFGAARDPRIWLLAVVYFGGNACTYGITLWLPNMIRRLPGVSDFLTGLVSVVPYVAAAAVMVLVGLHSDRSGERRWHTAIPAFAGAVPLMLAGSSTSLVLLIAAMSLAMAGVSSRLGPFWALTNGLLRGSAAATGIALVNSVGNLGGFFGPYIVGLARSATGQFRLGSLLLGLILALSGFLVLLVRGQNVRQA